MELIPPEELVARCRRTLPEDQRAFELLVARYKQRVFARAYRMMGNTQEAEDQAQEVFLKVYRGIHDLAEPATLASWIDRITVNTCLDAITRHKRRPATVPLAPSAHEGDDEPQYADARTATPEDAALQRELRRCLERALTQVDPAARAALMLRDIDDRPYQEIVDLLGIGLSAVKMRIHRARLAFQEHFERVCPGMWRPEPTARQGT